MTLACCQPDPDVVVIGAGAIGASAAYELARRGARVTVLERSETPRRLLLRQRRPDLPEPCRGAGQPGRDPRRPALDGPPRQPVPPAPAARRSSPGSRASALAARPARSNAATAQLRALAERSLALHARLPLETSFARRGILSVYERGRRAGHAQRGAGPRARARPLPRHRRRRPAPGRGALRPGHVRRRAARRRARARRGGAHRRRDPAPAAHQRADRRARHDRRPARRRHGRAGRRARGRASSRPRSASTCRSSRPRATTSRSTRPALQAGIPIYMEQSRVIATPLGGRLRLAGTLELAGHDLSVDPVRLDSLLQAARRTLELPQRRVTQGLARAAAVRARRAADHRARGGRREPRSGHRACHARHHARARDGRDRGRPGSAASGSGTDVAPFSPGRFRRLRDVIGA